MSWNIASNKLKELILLDAILALLELQLLLMFLAQQLLIKLPVAQVK